MFVELPNTLENQTRILRLAAERAIQGESLRVFGLTTQQFPGGYISDRVQVSVSGHGFAREPKTEWITGNLSYAFTNKDIHTLLLSEADVQALTGDQAS